MRSSPEFTIRMLFDAWRRQDVEGVLALCAEDIRYTLHLPPGLSRYGGTLDGRDAVEQYLRAVCDAWEFVALEPGPMRCHGGLVREMSTFRSRHRRNRGIVESCKRHVWQVEFGLVTSCDEFQDTALMQAFLSLEDMI